MSLSVVGGVTYLQIRSATIEQPRHQLSKHVHTVTRVQGRHSLRATHGNSFISLTADFLSFIFLNFDQSKKKSVHFREVWLKTDTNLSWGGGVDKNFVCLGC